MARPSAVPFSHTVAALIVIGAAVTMVVLLLGVDPDARGFGTHEQLGMASCSWPELHGIPCPTCGCTTAAAHLVHLSPWRALTEQPFGAAFALGGLWLAVIALHSLIRGRSFVERISLWPYARIFVGGAVLLFLAWGYKCLTWDAV